MNIQNTELQLRRFLIWVIGFIFIGTVFELILLEHYMKPLQFIPYLLSGLGLASLIAVRINPNRKTISVLRWIMVLIAAGSLFGMFWHFNKNMQFARSINPTFSFMEALWPAMKGGNPLLAPGILFLAGVLGVAVTYKHPVMNSSID